MAQRQRAAKWECIAICLRHDGAVCNSTLLFDDVVKAKHRLHLRKALGRGDVPAEHHSIPKAPHNLGGCAQLAAAPPLWHSCSNTTDSCGPRCH